MRDQLRSLMTAIIDDNQFKARQLLREDPLLAVRFISEGQYEKKIGHWIYAKDTPLHAAAAGHRVEIARMLLSAGADLNAARNHLQSQPLHYAADACINNLFWNADRQVSTISLLLEAGAAVDARDKSGATPLHRAVRNHCAAAVECLLNAHADASIQNKSGLTPFHLAVQSLDRREINIEKAQAAQHEIITAFLRHGVSASLTDAKGKTVSATARSLWIRQMLVGADGKF